MAFYSMSNEERAEVRKIISSHPMWKAYRKEKGINTAMLDSETCYTVCEEFGIDIELAKKGASKYLNGASKMTLSKDDTNFVICNDNYVRVLKSSKSYIDFRDKEGYIYTEDGLYSGKDDDKAYPKHAKIFIGTMKGLLTEYESKGKKIPAVMDHRYIDSAENVVMIRSYNIKDYDSETGTYKGFSDKGNLVFDVTEFESSKFEFKKPESKENKSMKDEQDTNIDKEAQAKLELLQEIFGGSKKQELDKDEVKKIIIDELDRLALKPKVIVMDKDDNKMGELPPTRHEKLELLLTVATMRNTAGRHENIWLSGPAGSGKSYACEQVAKALNIDYGYHPAMMMTHELLGFVDAGGKYHETAFVKAYRNGGVVVLEEIDNSSPEIGLVLNPALASNRLELPNGESIERHKDFLCIGCANTWGFGATTEYVGRNRLDAAFLDRFGVKIDWNYDTKLEKSFVPAEYEEWLREILSVRQKCKDKGIKVVISPRATIAGVALLNKGIKQSDVAELTYLAGMTPDQKKMIKG